MKWYAVIGRVLPRALRERLVLRAIRKALLAKGFTEEQVDKLLGGWKSKAGAIGMIAAGIGLIANEVAQGTFDYDMIFKGLGMIGAGFGILGVAGKVEKNTAAVLATSDNPAAREAVRTANV